MHVLIAFFQFVNSLLQKLKNKTFPRLSMKACSLIFIWGTRAVFAGKIKRMECASLPFNDTEVYVQDNSKWVILYCTEIINESWLMQRKGIDNQIYVVCEILKLCLYFVIERKAQAHIYVFTYSSKCCSQ